MAALVSEMDEHLGYAKHSPQGQYLKSVEYLHTEGLIGEIFNDFMEGYAELTCSRIDNLVSHIDGNDIPAVERVIRYLESYSM